MCVLEGSKDHAVQGERKDYMLQVGAKMRIFRVYGGTLTNFITFLGHNYKLI
jgi:hypothetical protein